jgi:hypothetical protein
VSVLREWEHLYAGQCPDALHPGDLDPACPVCRQMLTAQPPQ